MKQSLIKKRRKLQALSLVELLVVIAVIGIIAAIAIPQVSKIMRGGSAVQAQRNAQTIAQVAAAAQAAGNDDIEIAADLDAAIQIVANATHGDGGFSDMGFSFSDIGTEEINRAKVYLDFVGGVITYDVAP